MLTVNLPSGDKLEFSTPVQVKDVALKIGPGLAKATVAAFVDDMLVGTDFVLPEDGETSIRLITKKDPEALAIMRHSCAHIMARAVMRLFDGVELAFGPTVENGFYYDFAMPKPISEADFEAIEKEMAKIVKEDEPFERIEMPRDEAIKLLEGMGQKL